MLTKTFSKLVVGLAVALIGLTNQSHAGDIREISPADYKKAQTAMKEWLALVDNGKYAESFAAASEFFRKNSSAEKWKTDHAKMMEAGPVVTRGEMAGFTPMEKPNPDTLPSSYFVTFKTKFQKKSGTEHLQIVKENDQWKVAAYSIDIDK